MSIEQTRATIISNIWKSISQSKIDISSLSPEQQESLVRAIADGMMLTLDDFLDDIDKTEPENKEESKEIDDTEEIVIWKGRPLLSLVEHVTITNQRIKIEHGLVGRSVENFELIRIQDIDLKQNMGERMLGIGDIHILGHDPSNPEITLRNLRKPDEVYENLRRAWLDARKKYGLQFREYM
jgi:hypothetical protein